MPPPIEPFTLNTVKLESAPERISQIEHAEDEIELWASDPEGRRRIDEELADDGYDATFILTTTLIDNVDFFESFDKRISILESRRNAVLREIERYNESLARRLDRARADIIDGEFTEAAD